MNVLVYRFPDTIYQLKEQYPTAYEYLTRKSKYALSISIVRGHVMVRDQFGWCKYDIQDIKIFNQLEVNGL